jgi:hypothetical protein
MPVCILCRNIVTHIHKHQRAKHPLDYRPPLVKGDQFRCCGRWNAVNKWCHHYKIHHAGQLPPDGPPKHGDDNRRSAGEANESNWIEYCNLLRAKGYRETEISAVSTIDEDSIQHGSQSQPISQATSASTATTPSHSTTSLNTRKDAAADSLSVERALEKLQELKNEHNQELVERIAASQWSSINDFVRGDEAVVA